MRTQLITVMTVLEKTIEVLHETGTLNHQQAGGMINALSAASEQLRAIPCRFDNVRFAAALKNTIGDRSLREVSVEVGVSISTLSRLTLGNKPDIDTFATVCHWMNTLPTEFFTSNPQ